MWRLGSYITQGAYTVSGPFHPFGGAVDMAVLQQEDGSLKSSPWYVRFGKFQGVLKAKERVVDINVNGIDADFHMYLDPRGEAFFLKQIDSDEVAETLSSRLSLCEEIDGKGCDKLPVKSKSMSYEFDQCDNSKRSGILGFVLESNGEFQDVLGDSVLMKQVSEPIVDDPLIFGDFDDSDKSIDKQDQKAMNGPDPPTVRTFREHLKVDIEELKGNIRRCPTYVDIPTSCEVTEAEIIRRAKSLPNLWSQFDDSNEDNHEDFQFYSPVGKYRLSNWDLLREEAARIKKAKLEKELAESGKDMSTDLKDGDSASGGKWSLWPFRRTGSKSVSETSKKDSEVEIGPDGEKEDCSPKLDKMHKRALTPTPEQLASLNLEEGQNTVTFTFSTSVLGPQKVDARIYLWRWDTRIVISDVDGTITKSDVLGQFMPLVGRDWSHIGVTHLFSGIKDNGYQMLYLSARAVSQASLTRQFLFNLKQDGKALPDGPVVISPDGLFPSLFREVIRRAPHEFKIACLEDIKACFPSDRNPFYAGFGNRHTDEFSYLKVGIAMGKIFIINPKGEVIINRCIDSKSYASLHALVNGIFPPISGHEEQEDYNSWNFWKLPPPSMD